MILLFLLVLLPYFGVSIHDQTSIYSKYSSEESLSPYAYKHGSRLNHRSIRDCHPKEYGNAVHELYPAHKSENLTLPFVKINRFVKDISHVSFLRRIIRGHYIIVSNPLKTLSVVEPHQSGGCSLNIRQTVVNTSIKANCVLAINAGYFDTKVGTCHGNVISNGRRAQDSKGVQNAHFGLTEDGQIFFGYLSREEYLSDNFIQLVGGVVWILRNGTGFVNISKTLECEDTEETGRMDEFVNIFSARSAVGHDKDGNVILVQVDGKSKIDGINLYEMEELLKEFGVVNAINLDGGGSSTLVIDDVTSNYPYDACSEGAFSCDRKVSTILCVHSPYCDPSDCNKHGTCEMGECICEKNWLPPKCDQLFCGEFNCSSHGLCSEEGCVCFPGYFGEDCEKTCNLGWYGSSCSQQCNCVNANGCDPVTGACACQPGFIGEKCEHTCPIGYFGVDCQTKCQCENTCFCHPVSGLCTVPENSSLYQVAKCLANAFIKDQHLVKDNAEERRKWYLTIIILGIITSVCITSFLLVIFCSCSCYCRNEQLLCSGRARKRHKNYALQMPGGEISNSDSESESYPMKIVQKS